VRESPPKLELGSEPPAIDIDARIRARTHAIEMRNRRYRVIPVVVGGAVLLAAFVMKWALGLVLPG